MIAYVFKPRRKKDGKMEVARIYRGRYRLNGEGRLVELSLDTSDKQAAQKRLAEIIKEKELERAGIIAPKAKREAAR